MTIKKLFLPSFLAMGLLHAQSSVGLDINNEDLEILASVNLNTFTDYSDSTAYLLDGSYLYVDGDELFTIGLSAQNSLQGIEGLSLAFGAKLIFASDFSALPLFGKAIYALPLNGSIPPASLATSFAYAPTVLSFSDGESYSEFKLEADMEIISNFHLFTGYRNIKTEYQTYDKTFNNSFYGGMKLSF